MSRPQTDSAGGSAASDDAASVRTPLEPMSISSETLFQGAREIRITHDGTAYRMTITRLNKLILTK